MTKIESAFSTFITLLILPVTILNLFAGLVGGIWILFYGNWQLVVYALLLGILSVYLASFALLPAMIGLPIVSWATQHKNRIVLVLGSFISVSLTAIAISLVSYYLYSTIIHFSRELPIVAVTLLAYSVALAPWQAMASKENRNSTGMDGTTLSMFFICIGLTITSISYLVTTSLESSIIWLFLSMALYVVTATIFSIRIEFENPSAIDSEHTLKEKLNEEHGIMLPISGGDGLSIDSAIIIDEDYEDWSDVEYTCLRLFYKGKTWEVVETALINLEGRKFDEIQVKSEDGTTIYYFDVTAYVS